MATTATRNNRQLHQIRILCDRVAAEAVDGQKLPEDLTEQIRIGVLDVMRDPDDIIRIHTMREAVEELEEDERAGYDCGESVWREHAPHDGQADDDPQLMQRLATICQSVSAEAQAERANPDHLIDKLRVGVQAIHAHLATAGR